MGDIALRGQGKAFLQRKNFSEGSEPNEIKDVKKEKSPTTYEKKQKNIEDRKEKTKQMLEKKGYDTGKVIYANEKDIESPKMQNILKKYRKNIADPTGKFLGKIMSTGGDYDRGSDKARKEILGYKKGGTVKKADMLTAKMSKNKKGKIMKSKR
jgi:hypothetical protein